MKREDSFFAMFVFITIGLCLLVEVIIENQRQPYWASGAFIAMAGLAFTLVIYSIPRG